MGKKCAITGCESGTRSEKKRKDLHGIRQASIFSVPKYVKQLDKWNKAIGQVKKLKVTDFVCELHFAFEDIIRQDEIKLVDGSIYVSERSKYKLKQNAILMSWNQENISPQTNVESMGHGLIEDGNNVLFSIENDVDNLREQCILMHNAEEINEEVNENVEIMQNNSPSQQSMLNDLYKETTMNIDFTIDTLKQYLETMPLRKTWSWMEHASSNGLLQSHSVTLQLRLYIEIHHDLSVILFSESVRVAMAVYENDEQCAELKDSSPTQKFIEKVNNLISAMMSQIPTNALRLDDTNVHKKVTIIFQ
ncbi:hypothetical protein DMN91_003511 [Ooceraea biroi]|uniref:THAP-type domain-containing protein n=1 Tax=Ooceraea biroi TaxID=2015173 RepID=A0A3L8DSA9_OOCBI|nr:hypothetical protein DMN91_003511 [Ooceraea biroi]